MKLDDLRKEAAEAQEALRAAEHGLADLQRKARAAKTKAEQTRIQHKHARKAAKQAKKLVGKAEEYAVEQLRVLTKAQRRLVKALKKAEKGKIKKPTRAASAVLPKASPPKLGSKKRPPTPIPRPTSPAGSGVQPPEASSATAAQTVPEP
jgi:hypothetical protein